MMAAAVTFVVLVVTLAVLCAVFSHVNQPQPAPTPQPDEHAEALRELGRVRALQVLATVPDESEAIRRADLALQHFGVRARARENWVRAGGAS